MLAEQFYRLADVMGLTLRKNNGKSYKLWRSCQQQLTSIVITKAEESEVCRLFIVVLLTLKFLNPFVCIRNIAFQKELEWFCQDFHAV